MPPHRFFSFLVVSTLLAASLAPPLGAQRTVRWRSGAAPAPATDTPATRLVLLDALRAGERHVVLQLGQRASSVLRQQLAAAGVELETPLGGDAWFAALELGRLDPIALAALTGTGALAGVARVTPAWKLHPDFAPLDPARVPEYSRVNAADPFDPVVAAYVVFHADVDAASEASRALVEKLDGRVVSVVGSLGAMVVEMPLARLGTLAGADPVQWIEPPLPPMSEVSPVGPVSTASAGAPPNDSNRTRVQADQVQAAPYGLDGGGVTVLVYDAGTALASHQDFGGRVTTHDSSGTIDHATHVSGTIGGSGAASGGAFRGMAPDVKIESYGLQTDGSSIFLYTNVGDIESDYDQAINAFGADVANNSIGTNTETNGFPCNIQGDYGVCAALIDSIVRGSLGAPFRIVWANGNERQGSSCDIEGFGDYYSTAPPATAKNHIAVGALNSNDDSMTSFSSWGPTDDGRLKPDVSAPGCQSGSDGGVTSPGAGSTSEYIVYCGTSMASPTVAGCVALMLEDFRASYPAEPDPRNSTVKILLAQEAVDLGNTGPDYQFGYGSVRVKETIDFQRLGRFDEQTLADQGASHVYSVTTTGAESELKVTLAWDDVPGTPNVFGSLVNDLDLRVIDPLGARHYPWTLNPANPGAAAVKTAEDHANNVEQVHVANPIAGAWRVEVHGFDVPAGPQPFSICASHALDATPFVQIGFPSGMPATVTPGTPVAIQARVEGVGEALAGLPSLHYRLNGGAYASLAMTSVGGDLFAATLPAAFCGDAPELYVSAAGLTSGAATNPPDAPATAFALGIEDTAVVFADDFETDKGWTVASTSLTGGAWERGIPSGDGGRNDPLVDFDGSGRCFLTENGPGNTDVDGGPATLTSPLLDLSAPGAYRVRFAAWFANDDFDADDLVVEVSANGGTAWTSVMSLQNSSGWVFEQFDVAAFVAPTASVRVRFRATDNPNNSITEAALDAFEVVRVTCDVTPTVVAEFAASPASGTAPLAVSFTDLSTGAPTAWTWSFGDGGSSAVQHPAHVYAIPGTYTVSLDVAGAAGSDGETKTDLITAAKPPAVGAQFGAGSPGSLGFPSIAAHSALVPGAAFYLVGGNLPPGTPAFLGFSLHKFDSPMDLTNGLVLNLNVPLLMVAPATASAGGEALVLVNLPAGFLGVPVHGQCIALDGTGGDVFATSPGVTVTLP
jgi:hypothetical protein